MKTYFRIPFTWYWVAKVTPFEPENPKSKMLFCLATKRWDSKLGAYYWCALT